MEKADKQSVHYTMLESYYSKTESLWLSTSFLVFKRSLWNEKVCFKKDTVDDLDFILRVGNLKTCIIIKLPATVAYRYHDGNSIHDILINIVRLSNMLSLEKQGEYPGGERRKMDRMAIIGGHIYYWGLKGIKKHFKEALTLLGIGLPAIVAGVLKKIKNWNINADISETRM